MARDELRPAAAMDARPEQAGASYPPRPMLVITGRLLRAPRAGRSLPPASPVTGLVVDREGRETWVDAARIELTFREFELLDFLTSNPGKVFSRAQLLGRVWGRGLEHDTRTVDVHVHRLRRKLGTR